MKTHTTPFYTSFLFSWTILFLVVFSFTTKAQTFTEVGDTVWVEGFGGKEIKEEIRFRRKNINSDEVADDWRGRRKAINFKSSQFHQKANFRNSQFHQKANFRDSQFHQEANFGKSQFHQEAYFWPSQFHQEAYFGESQFRGETRFRDSQFHQKAHFRGSQFFLLADFDKSQFFQGVNFIEGKFHQFSNFNENQFHQRASFWRSNFYMGAYFSKSQFLKGAVFSACKFLEEANFEQSQFYDKTTFSESEFFGKVVFSGSQFQGEVIFTRLVQSEDVMWIYYNVFCQFHQNVNFNDCKFYEKVNFKYNQFYNDLDFTNTLIYKNIDFSYSEFYQKANFRHSRFDTIAIFNYIQFHCDLDFEGTIFNDKVTFKNTILPEYLSLQEVKSKEIIDFTYAKLSEGKERCKINLLYTDLSKIRINYELFELFFPVGTPLEVQLSVYEKLLKRFQEDGFTNSYQLLYAEYEDFKWRNETGFNKFVEGIRYYVSRCWWYFGFKKWRIFGWILGFLSVFLVFTYAFYPKIATAYHIKGDFYKKDASGESCKSIVNAAVFTFIIFFGLRLNLEKLQKINFWSFSIFVINVVGTICLAYLLGFIIVN